MFCATLAQLVIRRLQKNGLVRQTMREYLCQFIRTAQLKLYLFGVLR